MAQHATNLSTDLKILVAEDHDINRFIIQKMFKDGVLNAILLSQELRP
jgi:hypothetical protein